jgi:hypothetical protein
MKKLTQDHNELSNNYIIGIGSEPTEYAAMQFGCSIAKQAIKRIYDCKEPYKIEIINSCELQELRSDSLDILVIYNILQQATFDRIQAIRDAVEKYENALRIIIIAGSDPVSFFSNKLHLSLDGAFYFTRSRGTISV